jgi:phage terminase large subunit
MDSALTITQPDGSVLALYTPLPHQLLLHQASEPNVLLEGGRGSGKSLALRFDAHMRALMFPGFTYLLLRRTMPELRRSHLHFIEAEMKQLGGYYHKTENCAVYPNSSKGYFSHVETEADILNFLSSAFGDIYWDELSTFSLKMFTEISTSARAEETAPYTAIVRAGTNPLGEGASWVRQWFLDKSVNLWIYPDYHPSDFKSIHSTYLDKPTTRTPLGAANVRRT